jgi:hypothetical protein
MFAPLIFGEIAAVQVFKEVLCSRNSTFQLHQFQQLLSDRRACKMGLGVFIPLGFKPSPNIFHAETCAASGQLEGSFHSSLFRHYFGIRIVTGRRMRRIASGWLAPGSFVPIQ